MTEAAPPKSGAPPRVDGGGSESGAPNGGGPEADGPESGGGLESGGPAPDGPGSEVPTPASSGTGAGVPTVASIENDLAEPLGSAEEMAARLSTPEQPLGRPGPRMDRRSPFYVGAAGAAGVAVTYGLVLLVEAARDVLLLIVLAWLLAIGLHSAVTWLTRRRVPRGLAVSVVLLSTVVLLGGFVAAAIPPLVDQTTRFVHQGPALWNSLRDHSSALGRLNDQFHIQQRLAAFLSQDSGSLLQGLVGAGQVVLGVVGSTLTVLVLTAYFVADQPRIRQTIYRLVPASRRPRAILLGDDIFTSVSGFVLGNLFTSLIAGGLTFVWTIALGVPYPLLLAIFVAIMDLIPVVGSTLAGVVVTLTALSVSLPTAIATAVFILVYRFAEDYLLVPKVMNRTVRLPAVVTFVAVLVGGVLLGVVGAVVAIPLAAAIRLILIEVVFPRLDRS